MTAEEANGRESGGVEESGGGLRLFWDEKRNDTRRATIYMFENISSDSSSLIGLESVPKRFWFKTATDEGIISRD
jgi:hypothetical protein